MKVIIVLHLIPLVLSATVDLPSPSTNASDHEASSYENSTTRITRVKPSNQLSMIFKTPHVIIAPHAFRNSGIKTLHLTFDPSANSTRNYGTISLQAESFIGLDLDSLSFKRTDLNINLDALIPIRSLHHLTIDSCNIVEVPTVLLTSFPNLESLVLSQNNMPVIHHNAFEVLKRLWYLDLSSNNINTLESGCFNGLEDLDRLILSNNSFRSIPAVFEGLPRLTELHIRNCQDLERIDITAFRDVPTLTAITISYTGLQGLQPGIFNGLGRLGWLQLSNNRINRIQKGVFDYLESLQYLFLDHNEIVRIESHAFSGMNLRYLGLSYQNLRSSKGIKEGKLVIEKGAFNRSTTDIIRIVGVMNPDMKSGAFEGLTAELVDLNCGGLKKIETGVFSGLRTRKLNLRKNRINEIAKDAFEDLIVEEIDISANLIKRVDDNVHWGISKEVVVII